MRGDQEEIFVLASTGETVVWLVSGSYLYHATVDGLRAACNRAIAVHDDATIEDRSRSIMTCEKCAEIVKRRPGPPRKVDLDAAIRRAWQVVGD